MAVARIHGKVKCRPFKEKRRRAPFTKHGITGDSLFVSRFLSCTEAEFWFLQGLAVPKSAGGRSKFSGCPFTVPPPGNRLQWSAAS